MTRIEQGEGDTSMSPLSAPVGHFAAAPTRVQVIDRWTRVALVGLTVLNCAMVLSLRAFPSHDGPMHTYLARVTQDLLSGGKEFGQYYALKTLVTPYAFNTYTLIALNQVTDPIVSDKAYVCLVVVMLCAGFYAMARSVSPSAGAVGLLVGPLMLHKSVFLGFQNFSASIGMALFLCALWMGNSRSWRGWKSLVFVAVLALLSVTHPVGILVVGLFLAIHTSIEALQYLATTRGPWLTRVRDILPRLGLPAAHLGLCALPLIFIVRFIPKGPGGLVFDLSYWALQLGKFAVFGPIAAFQTWYYASPQALIVVCAAIGLWTSLRGWPWASPEAINGLACLTTAAMLTIVYILSPQEMGGAAHFDQRFPMFALLFFLAAAAWNRAPEYWHWLTGVVALAVSLFVLGVQTVQCRRLDADLAPVLDAPTMPRGSVGVLAFEGPRQIYPLSFSPNLYGGVHYFLRSHAVLLNAPDWIEHPIMLLTPADPQAGLDSLGSPPVAHRIRFRNPDFVLPLVLEDRRHPIDFLLQGQALPNSGTGEARVAAGRRGFVVAPWRTGCFNLYTPRSARQEFGHP